MEQSVQQELVQHFKAINRVVINQTISDGDKSSIITRCRNVITRLGGDPLDVSVEDAGKGEAIILDAKEKATAIIAGAKENGAEIIKKATEIMTEATEKADSINTEATKKTEGTD